MKTGLKRIGLLLLVVFIIAQFFGPEKNEGSITSITPFLEDTNPPETVKTLLKNACIDCHSNHTRYPLYSKITPVNYWMANHVEHGKDGLNLSKWNDYSDKKKDHKLEEIIEEVEEGHMPISSYKWTHANARLSEQQIEALITWATKSRAKYLLREQPQ